LELIVFTDFSKNIVFNCINVPIHVYGAAVGEIKIFHSRVMGKKVFANIDDRRIMHSWRSCLLFIFKHNTSLFNTDNYGTIAELCPLKR
jgi:hypothetical protein